MSRDAPPPLPGGYTVGEKVFFTGTSQTFPSGNKVVHGQQGEVGGPSTLENTKGKGVRVRFPGNKQSIGCFLTEVRRLRSHPPLCATHATLHAYVPRGRPYLDPTPTASHCGGGSAGEGPCRTSPLCLLVNARS